MKVWLAPWILAHFGRRSVAVLALVWLVSSALFAAYCWSAGRIDTNDLAEIGVRTLGLFITSLGSALWLVYVASINEQLSPAAVQLVPRLQKSAVAATLCLWLFMSAAIAIEMWLVGGPFWALLSLTATVLAFAVTRASLGGLPLLAAVVMPMVGAWAPRLGLSGSSALTWKDVQHLAVTIVVGTVWITRQLGGSAESRSSTYERSRKAHRARRDPNLRAPWMMPKRRALFATVFARVLRTPSPAARAIHGVSPGFHWSEAVLRVLWFTVVASLGAMLGPGLSYLETKTVRIDLVMLVGSAACFTFASSAFLASRLLHELSVRNKEQALLVLLPGVPNRADTPWLMRALLRQHAIAASTALVLFGGILLALHLAFDVGPSESLRMVAAGLAIPLLATPVLAQNFATLRASVRWWLLLLIPVEFVAQILVTAGKVSGATIILIATLVAVIWTAARYGRLRDAPRPFPVGRLAS